MFPTSPHPSEGVRPNRAFRSPSEARTLDAANDIRRLDAAKEPLTIKPSVASQADQEIFDRLTSVELSPDEKRLAATPTVRAPGERRLMAIHFHPEWVPMPLIEKRLSISFPDAEDFFVVPTQHNQVMALGEWAGVEADVYAPEYGEKIQLLIHLKSAKLEKAASFKGMMERTFRYRALQLLEILEALNNPDAAMAAEVKKAGLDSQALSLAAGFSDRLGRLIEDGSVIASPRAAMLKNRLLTDFMQELGGGADQAVLGKALSVVKLVKSLVKKRFDPKRFHTAAEVIEEARGLGAGVVIPHPPLFWPALLDDLDIDGWEVWNSSTPKHTLFLIDCLGRARGRKRPLLAFMGDDTHMSSKIRPDSQEDKSYREREIGFQPPWADPKAVEALKAIGQSRERTMDEYRSRIA